MGRGGLMMRWWMGGRSLGALALLFGLIAGYTPWPAEAQVTFSQITNSTALTGGGNVNPSINSDGTRIAFESHSDLTGGNPNHAEVIFLWTQGSGFTQITTGGGSYIPSINSDGTRIAFRSMGDLVPSGNADHNIEIFLWTQGSGFTQITNTTSTTKAQVFSIINNFSPHINADGTRIVFLSDGDLVPGDNADHNVELFLWTQGSGITQITNTTGGDNNQGSINPDGTKIAFFSVHDLTGGNPDGNYEIFLWTQGSGITQITSSTGGPNWYPSINADGTKIAFFSNRDLTGGNPGTNPNGDIFLWTQGSGFTQITNTTGNCCSFSYPPSINSDGTRIAFAHTDINPDYYYQIFLWTQGSGLTKITNQTANGNYGPSINADGTRIAFFSNRDLTGTGGNPDYFYQIFLAQISTVPPNPPVLSVSPSSRDFGTIAVGASKDLTLTVTNTGGDTLTGSASASAPFSIIGVSAFSLSTGQSQDITVRFSPTTGGTFVSNVSVTSNGGSASPSVQATGLELKEGVLNQIREYLPHQNYSAGNFCFLDKNFLTLADVHKIEDRIDDTDVQVYIDSWYLASLNAVAAYTSLALSSSEAQKVWGNPLSYFNDVIIGEDPTIRYDNGLAVTLIHEMFHAIFDQHDFTLFTLGVSDDEALTSYFDEAVSNLGTLAQVETELKKEKDGSGQKCSRRVVRTKLRNFTNKLRAFLRRPHDSKGHTYKPIRPPALELMKQLTGFDVPITKIVDRYLSGECGVCSGK